MIVSMSSSIYLDIAFEVIITEDYPSLGLLCYVKDYMHKHHVKFAS